MMTRFRGRAHAGGAFSPAHAPAVSQHIAAAEKMTTDNSPAKSAISKRMTHLHHYLYETLMFMFCSLCQALRCGGCNRKVD